MTSKRVVRTLSIPPDLPKTTPKKQDYGCLREHSCATPARTGDEHGAVDADAVRHGQQDFLEDKVDDGERHGHDAARDAVQLRVRERVRRQHPLQQRSTVMYPYIELLNIC